jgi:aminocarboxymuconate-semialdehyde decarboxylase
MRVDFHTHIIPEDLPNLAERFRGERWPVLERTCACGANIMVAGKVFREVTDQVWDPVKRIHDMEREKVDMQVLSPIPVTFSYWAPAEEAEVMARIQNDLKGIEIGTNVNGHNLDDPSLIEFFEMCQKWEVPLFVHPWETLGKERMPRHNLMYTVGMPSETALAAASLIMGGVIEKFPGLKICFAHGGGSFPYILPRLDQGWKVWPHLRLIEQPPSYYAKNFYFDSLNYDPMNIRYLLDRFGDDRILMGSDYPFLLREIPPGQTIDDTLEITDEQKRAMLGENALRFLNISDRKGR